MNNQLKTCAIAFAVAVTSLCSSLVLAQAQDQYLQEYKLPEPKKESGKIRFLWKASSAYNLSGAGWDASTTGLVMRHPTLALRTDGSSLGRYNGVETGWAGVLGKRNTFAATTANIGLNFGVNLLSRRIYRRGGAWRWVAIGLNLWKGTDSWMAGAHNVNVGASFDRRVRLATGYQGRIIWRR